jgi:uncharacterized protein (DUF3820 family)
MSNTCPHCGSTNLVTSPTPGGPHHARTDCGDCGHFLRWEPAPVTAERANAFTLPFGQYVGRTLAEVAATAEGRRYLAWLQGAEHTKRTLRDLIAVALACREASDRGGAAWGTRRGVGSSGAGRGRQRRTNRRGRSCSERTYEAWSGPQRGGTSLSRSLSCRRSSSTSSS